MFNLSPESIKWLAYASSVTRNGVYDEGSRLRTGCALANNNTLVLAGVYNEGGHHRVVLDSAEKRHTVTTLGFLCVFNQPEGLSTEIMFLQDGRTFQFEFSSGCEPSRKFIAATKADEILQQAVQI